MIEQTNKIITVATKIETGEDALGVPIVTTIEQTLKALVAWGSTGLEFGVERNTLTTQGTIYLTKSNQIAQGSDIFIDGKLYRIDGEALTWETPDGFSLEVGQVVPIKRVEG